MEIVVIDGVEYDCGKYIYPMLDWNTRPLLATLVIVVCVLLQPVTHLVWVGMYHLRLRIYNCTLGRTVPQVSKCAI